MLPPSTSTWMNVNQVLDVDSIEKVFYDGRGWTKIMCLPSAARIRLQHFVLIFGTLCLCSALCVCRVQHFVFMLAFNFGSYVEYFHRHLFFFWYNLLTLSNRWSIYGSHISHSPMMITDDVTLEVTRMHVEHIRGLGIVTKGEAFCPALN
jgi:hypothetical protein